MRVDLRSGRDHLPGGWRLERPHTIPRPVRASGSYTARGGRFMRVTTWCRSGLLVAVLVLPGAAAAAGWVDHDQSQDGDLKQQVEKALGQRDDLKDANVDVEVRNGVARLTGTIAREEQRVTVAFRAGAISRPPACPAWAVPRAPDWRAGAGSPPADRRAPPSRRCPLRARRSPLASVGTRPSAAASSRCPRPKRSRRGA
ncbi:MAG: BON domain-containing protein [Deltaproteobacteria bacterium]|nr:MAG: BON domain-containing protein [Deltaproteobacteria bacterium]